MFFFSLFPYAWRLVQLIHLFTGLVSRPHQLDQNEFKIYFSFPESVDEESSEQSLFADTVERETVSHKPKTWRQWFKDPRFYAVKWIYCFAICVFVVFELFSCYLFIYF